MDGSAAGWESGVAVAHFVMKSALRVRTPRVLLATVLSSAGWSSVNDLKRKSASGVILAGFDGGLSDWLDWWAGRRQYDSSGRDHSSPWKDTWMGVCYKRP